MYLEHLNHAFFHVCNCNTVDDVTMKPSLYYIQVGVLLV